MTAIRRREFLGTALRGAAAAPVVGLAWTCASPRERWTDVGETRDLAAAQPGAVRELSAKLDAWLGETKAKLPRPNPSHEKKEA